MASIHGRPTKEKAYARARLGGKAFFAKRCVQKYGNGSVSTTVRYLLTANNDYVKDSGVFLINL